MAGKKSGKPQLTHIDAAGRPAMVDVGDKAVTVRMASASADVRFPKAVAEQLRGQGMRSAKGAIIDTAVIAGTMAVKNTSQWIPFCHALSIEGCVFQIDWQNKQTLRILCTVRVTGKTGVEMEALTGASAAALTVYDMCKALSHAIEIGPVKLREKQGGKRTVSAQ
ncbi:MAG: cyclic pyranopterin monophosphate synthase MoaC [Arenimonas sp.]